MSQIICAAFNWAQPNMPTQTHEFLFWRPAIDLNARPKTISQRIEMVNSWCERKGPSLIIELYSYVHGWESL